MAKDCKSCSNASLGVAATNEVGCEIQTFSLPKGWVASAEHQFKTRCEACAVFKKLPKDSSKYRLYPTLVIK